MVTVVPVEEPATSNTPGVVRWEYWFRLFAV